MTAPGRPGASIRVNEGVAVATQGVRSRASRRLGVAVGCGRAGQWVWAGRGRCAEYGLVVSVAGALCLAREPTSPEKESAMTELVHLSVADAVATITLDSPHNRNALSRQLVAELTAHLETADIDPDVRVILLRSAHRVFCAGADLAEAAEGRSGATAALVALFRRIAAADTPVVVELAGPVVAGGLGIVGAADVVVASDDVTVQLTEVRLGLAPAVISLTLLPRLTSRAASDLFLSGRRIPAHEAVAAGFITRAVAADQLSTEVEAVVADLSRGTTQGLRETKRLLNRDLLARIDAQGDEMAELSERLFHSDEAKAAMKAFLTK